MSGMSGFRFDGERTSPSSAMGGKWASIFLRLRMRRVVVRSETAVAAAAGRGVVLAMSLALAPLLVSCGAAKESGRQWSASVKAPGKFAAWEGSGGVELPADREDFLRYVNGLGASYYVTGEGDARLLSSPPPPKGSPCLNGVQAIVFTFPIEPDDSRPGYIAYLDADGRVACVDKQFAYLTP
jgi:hypothetical protein